MKCSAVVAAAGLSSRMRDFKPMLRFGESTVIRRTLRNLMEAGAEEIVVVTGYRAGELAEHLKDLPVRLVENRAFAESTMFDSVCLGLRALEAPCDGVLVTPGDVPMVRPESIRAVMDAGAALARPVYRGMHGHPLLLGTALVSDILAYDGQDGLRGAAAALGQPFADVPVEDIGVTLDADTPEDYARLQYELAAREGRFCLFPEVTVQLKNETMVLTPETAQLLECIDSTGSLSRACNALHLPLVRGDALIHGAEEAFPFPVTEPAGVGRLRLTEKSRAFLRAYQTYRMRLSRAAGALFDELFPEELLS